MTMLLLLGLLLFLGWAALFKIDQTVRAQGQIIPGTHTQIIQAADGGVLANILVREGDTVSAGQVLAVLEKDRSNAAYEEGRANQAALAAALVRAQAEATGNVPRFGPEHKEFAAVQQALYEQRKLGLQQDLAALEEALTMAQEELRMNEALLLTGDISRLDVMRARRQQSELQGKIHATRNKYLQEARQEASKLAADLSTSRYKLEEKQSVLGHTELNSPVAGIVKYLKINTVGGVLRAGDELMQISPTDGDQLIEIKINPADIGQLKLGLPATIKLDAFDYATYGTLQGTLTYLSSDTLTEQSSNGAAASTFYRGRVQFNEAATQANHKLSLSTLKPGMTATVDIRTNARSVLQYIAKPIFKAFGGAMNER
jgi:adhesin transport system membrane fusion protein